MRTGMFGILLSALRSVGAWTWRPVVVKFAVLFGLYYLVTAMMDYLLRACGLVETGGVCGINIGISGFHNLVSLLDQVTGARYFLGMAAFPVGAKLMVCAWATRFFIRRLPFVG